jgi:potassium/hydrogen antiporter
VSLDLRVDATVLVVAMLLVGAVLTAALAARPGSRFRVPGALLFLGIGMLVGDDGLGLLEVSDAAFVRDIGVVALLVILFEGGLTTKPTDLRLAAVPGLLLSTVGVAVTAAITGTAIWLLFDLDPITAGLIGAVVSSTDAAAVFSMMRSTRLPRRVSAIVRIESGANDPIAVMLTVGLLATYDQGATIGAWIWFASTQLVGGGVVGAAVGLSGVLLMRRLDLGIEGLYPITVGAIGALAYGAAAAVGASGFVAVYATGLFIGALVPRHRRSILGFHEAIANAAEIGLFLLLGLLVFPSQLPAVAVPALMVALVLTLVARPVTVWLCTLGQGYRWRERTVLSVAGLKGAVPIVLATFPLTAGVDQANLVFDIVFFVVLVSLLMQGIALLPVINVLGMADQQPGWAPVAEALPLEGIEVDLIEVHITDGLFITGRRLVDADVPPGVLITAVVRDHQVIVPRGDTELRVGDVLLISAERDPGAVGRLTAWARGEGRDI